MLNQPRITVPPPTSAFGLNVTFLFSYKGHNIFSRHVQSTDAVLVQPRCHDKCHYEASGGEVKSEAA